MTEIRCVNTGSSGNGYIVKSGGEILILELGCKFMDYLEYVENLLEIVGCICSHAHGDHLNPSTAKEFIRRGIRVWVGDDVAKDVTIEYFFLLMLGRNTKIGGFIILPFKAPHNVKNYGFLIITPTNERILFLTDTTGVNLRFRDIDCILVECNHDDDTLLDNLDQHEVSMSHPEYHMGLDTCKKFCKENISASTKQIVLIHMSHANLNEQHAIDTIKEYCNFDNVAVAHKGDTFKIESDDF